MQRVSFACSCLMLGVACAGGEDAGTPSSFVEPGPTDAELQEHLHTLLDEFEPRVSAAARAELEEHVATASADASADAGVDAPGELASTNTVSAFLDLGELAFLSGSASGATWAFLRAVEEDPDDIAALAQLGFVLTYEERHADARPFLLHAYALGPDRLYTVLVTLGLSYAAEGDYERCIYFLERAVSNEPNDAHLQHELAKCYFRAGATGAGENALDIARRLSPDDPDIAATEANPPPAGPDEEPNIASGESDPGALSTAHALCLEQAQQRLADDVSPPLGEIYDADVELTAELVRAASVRSECELQCHRDLPPGGAQQMCDALCKSAECGAAKSAFPLARARILLERTRWHGASATMRGSYAQCSWSAYFRLRGRVARYERELVWDMIFQNLGQWLELQVETWSSIDENVELLAEEVEQICTAAEEEWEHVDWAHPTAFDPFRDLDLRACAPLMPSLCFHITNHSVNVTTPLWPGSPLTSELSYDARGGGFNMTLEAQVWSRSAGGGLVEGAATVKFDLQRGLGVKTEAKVAGQVSEPLSRERYLFTPRSD